MLSSDVILFPDSGPEFLRTLKTAVLYADRVHTCRFELPISLEQLRELATKIDQGLQLQGVVPELVSSQVRRSLAFLQFILETEEQIALLAATGILPRPRWPVVLEAVRKPSQSPSPFQYDMPTIFARLTDDRDKVTIALKRGLLEYPPGILDLLPMVLVLLHAQRIIGDEYVVGIAFFSEPPGRLFVLAVVLASLSISAETFGSVLLSDSPVFQAAIWAARDLLNVCPTGDAVADRKAITTRMGKVAVERNLPRADDLQLEQLLEIRTKYRPELEAFRSALAELATQIDPAQPLDKINLQIQDLVTTKVDPEIHTLRSALRIARINALKKMGPSLVSLAKRTVTATIAVAAGAPLDIVAAATLMSSLGPIGSMATQVFEGEVERKKLRCASQWSVLLRLGKK
jgi:hypothetical protein